MFNTLMSYLSRFSGMLMLIFAIVVVLILTILTVNTATNTSDSEVSVTQEEQPASTDEITYDGTSSETELVIVSEGDRLATIDAEGNPQSLGANSINLDSSDSVTITTVDSETDSESTGSVNSDALPNTGIGEVVLTSLIAIILLSYLIYNYITSRQTLQLQLLENNR